MDLEWLENLTAGWAGNLPAEVVSGLVLAAILMTARFVWRRCRHGLVFLVELAVHSAIVGALVLWLVPTVDRSEPGVFWPDLPPERLAVIAGVCWFGLGVALRALGLVAHFALFHVLLWLDTRVGVDHGGLTFADWMRELHARERLAGLEARRRRGRPIIDLRQKRAGRRASLAGQPVTANPFPSDSPAGVAWARGYQEWAMLALEVREHWRPAAWDETHPDP